MRGVRPEGRLVPDAGSLKYKECAECRLSVESRVLAVVSEMGMTMSEPRQGNLEPDLQKLKPGFVVTRLMNLPTVN